MSYVINRWRRPRRPHHRPVFTAVIGLGLAIVAAGNVAERHCQLDAPNGGERLEVGTAYTIRWRVIIEHNLENWDLWYSTTGAGGPWIPIALDLPPGDPSAGSEHTYQWTVPNDPSDRVRVRVRQDNVGTDYEDISDGDLSIVPPACPEDVNGDGVVDVLDLTAVLSAWGGSGGPADVNGDGRVDVLDLLAVLETWGPCPP